MHMEISHLILSVAPLDCGVCEQFKVSDQITAKAVHSYKVVRTCATFLFFLSPYMVQDKLQMHFQEEVLRDLT